MASRLVHWALHEVEVHSTVHRLVLVTLADFADSRGSASEPIEILAQPAGVSVRWCQRVLRDLVDQGLLEVEGKGGRGVPNRYRLRGRPEKGEQRVIPSSPFFEKGEPQATLSGSAGGQKGEERVIPSSPFTGGVLSSTPNEGRVKKRVFSTDSGELNGARTGASPAHTATEPGESTPAPNPRPLTQHQLDVGRVLRRLDEIGVEGVQPSHAGAWIQRLQDRGGAEDLLALLDELGPSLDRVGDPVPYLSRCVTNRVKGRAPSRVRSRPQALLPGLDEGRLEQANQLGRRGAGEGGPR
jgi:hypothetical protein